MAYSIALQIGINIRTPEDYARFRELQVF